MKNPLLGRLMKEKKEDVAHTSAFAEAQNGGGFGAASTVSFEKRQEIDAKRKVIGKYKDARIVSDRGVNAWKIRQENRQLGGNDGNGSGLRGGAVGGSAGGPAGSTTSSTAGSAGGSASSRPPVRKNPGIFR